MRILFAAGFVTITAINIFAAPNRIAKPLDSAEMRVLPGNTRRLAAPRYDMGEVDPSMRIDYAIVLIRTTAAQQSDLDQLLRDQQNPSSPRFHRWLSPEQYADRFGLSPTDQSKIVGWLTDAGLTVHAPARGRNWIAFSGSAGQVSLAFRTSIHRYRVDGEMHFANATAPSVPAAIADLVGAITGLDDFIPRPQVRVLGPPDYNHGTVHYLAPGDFSVIYNVAPLAAAGFDGTGQSIAVVGQSDFLANDITTFRFNFGLPANAPKSIVFGPDPGFTAAEVESDLDLEWAGALAPKATIYYVNSANVFNAILYAVEVNLAPVISVSYGICENDAPPYYRSLAQQANAEGITIVAAAGDSGAAGCDPQANLQAAAHGPSIQFPGNLPEVTTIGGTMFNEAGGAYWSTQSAASGASVLSYIPEVAWNETSVTNGLAAGGGGASATIPKPDWQSGPGVPADGARDTPDLALSAAAHDGYVIAMNGGLMAVGGTSAAAPSMAGIVALLNQYVVKHAIQSTSGLGNINPQLYRMAQSQPAAFHDVTAGNNTVPCFQDGPGCLTGSFGFSAGQYYDQATGLGSIDANMLITSWGMATNPVTVSLAASPSKVTVNDTVALTATVTAAAGSASATGTVSFNALEQTLGTAVLTSNGGQSAASISVPAWKLGVGSVPVSAAYAGDAAFSGGGATSKVQVTLPGVPGVAAITVAYPAVVYASQTGTQPETWQAAFTLREIAGVSAVVTGFTIDGVSQPLDQYFPSPDIPASGTLTTNVVLNGLAVPLMKTFGFTGTDLSGATWSRQVQVPFRAPLNEDQVNFNLWATPLTVQQNPNAPSGCQWSQQVTLDEISGYELRLVSLMKGSVDISDTIASVFGTTRLAPWGSLQGTICWNPAVTPSSDLLVILLEDSSGDQIYQEVNVNFAAPSGGGAKLSVSPSSLTLVPVVNPFQTTTLSVNLADRTQQWTASVFPANGTASWLQLSQYAGTGPATLTLQANPAGFEPGAYRATILFESPDSVPQWIAVPVMFVNSSAPGPVVSAVGNALSFATSASPGMMMTVFGTQLANTTQSAPGLPLGTSLAGVSVAVNGWPAPLLFVSPTQLNIQVPYEVGSGPAVLGIDNNGQIGGYQFTISPAAPGIFSAGGNIEPDATAQPGGYATIFVTGAGELNQAQPSGVPVPNGTPASAMPRPLLPLTVTVGGVPALVQFAGSTPGVVGLIQVNFVVPPAVAPGSQPVVVTAGGYPSQPVNITIAAP